MPTLVMLNRWKIQLYPQEREAAHLHVESAGEVFRFDLANLEQLATDIRRAPVSMARTIRVWGEMNRTALEAVYTDLLAGRRPDKTLFR